MSTHVVMPKADWQDVLDTVRAKTHSAGLIKSGELAAILDTFALYDVGAHFSAFALGTVTPASDVKEWSNAPLLINHGLGVKPNFYLIFSDKFENTGNTGDNGFVTFQFAAITPIEKSTSACGILGIGTAYSSITTIDHRNLKLWGASDYNSTTDIYENLVFGSDDVKVYASQRHRFVAGRTYHWVCGVMSNDN